MRNLLVHGCYDRTTLNTLKKLGITSVAFDLRARSPNLIPFSELVVLIRELKSEEVILIFENENKNTVMSFVDLLKNESVMVLLEFRDQLDLSYYHSLNLPFIWMYDPEGDWRSILLLPNLKGVLLPIKWKSEYHELPELWEIVEQRDLKVYLHAEKFEETAELSDLSEVNLSVDLTAEIETSYRCVDQERLMKMKIWRKLNENLNL